MSVLARAGALFVAPAAEPAARNPPIEAARAVVLGEAGVPVAAALAAGGCVGVWRAQPPALTAAPGTPGARRLAERLEIRGLSAVVRGRLAWVVLDADPVAAAAEAQRVAAAVEGPVAIAVAGPRQAAFEPLIADADRVVAVVAAGELGALVAAGCDCDVVPAPAPVERVLALAGWPRRMVLPERVRA